MALMKNVLSTYRVTEEPDVDTPAEPIPLDDGDRLFRLIRRQTVAAAHFRLDPNEFRLPP
jgi:hypothetical protein